MNQTANYQLSQWETTDRILMSDFNNDNSKIDAALKANAEAIAALETQLDAKADQADLTDLAKRSRFTKLKEVDITSDTTSIEIDLSGIDWTQWANVHLDYKNTNGSQMWLYLNSESSNNRFHSISYSSGAYRPWLTLNVGFRSDRLISGNDVDDDFRGYVPYSQVEKFIVTGGTMPAGAHFIVWGEK